jgi:DNA invertase Pin-like site-specific DNA recombinase
MKSKKNSSVGKSSGKSSTDRRTAVCVRVITAAQHEKEGTSLESQVAGCKQQAEEDGSSVNLAYVYREQRTGADLNRPVLDQLLQAVQAGEVSVVYVYSADRLSP